MKSRRKKPKGNPQEEMEAALKELEIVSLNLHYSFISLFLVILMLRMIIF